MSDLFAGLMSGTSLDGIDAALVRFDGDAERPDQAGLIAFRTDPYEQDLASRLTEAVSGRAGAQELCDLAFELGERFSDAVLALLADANVAASEVTAIGSHGQTIWHRPPAGGSAGATLQIGESAVLAERTGIDVIADFRVRDVAAGGHGAPLTPLFDLLVLADPERGRAIQNLGGMGNVTGLPRPGSNEGPIAFDTGPGVALLDAATRKLTGGRLVFDTDGALAADGTVIDEALDVWLEDPFFARSPPRSTGRERFGNAALEPWLGLFSGARTEDLLATLTELTARTVGDSYRFLGFHPDEVLLCGGGARNRTLVEMLRRSLPDSALRTTDELGISAEAKEAVSFAILAAETARGVANNVPAATGAERPVVLGKIVPAGGGKLLS